MWQSGGMGAHAANNPWMKLMGIVHKERRHHDSGSAAAAASGVQGSATTGSNDRTLNHLALPIVFVNSSEGIFEFVQNIYIFCLDSTLIT
ncbi:potassium voltage-gated channel protein Shaker isoform X1 [Apis mellifera caucasica]|nr:potassium voltage-gated channel protein Shaker isoform X1 [Apis mellifera caucasica]